MILFTESTSTLVWLQNWFEFIKCKYSQNQYHWYENHGPACDLRQEVTQLPLLSIKVAIRADSGLCISKMTRFMLLHSQMYKSNLWESRFWCNVPIYTSQYSPDILFYILIKITPICMRWLKKKKKKYHFCLDFYYYYSRYQKML